MNVINQVKTLGFDLNRIIVVGSSVMQVYGLRKARDVDMVASSEIISRLESDRTWHTSEHVDGSPIYTNGDFQIGANWFGTGTKSDFQSLLARKDTFMQSGVRFIGLPTLLEWKKRMDRPKDQADIKLIEDYLRDGNNINA